MAEAVRLVIWDLDETFWDGTLTEGGITIRPERCNLVKELARRGIMSSICSKNNFDDVRVVLEREEIWDYFVFPSINWDPKGPRIAAMIEDVQLRPETILFIDDNPQNLEEVRHFVPGIQVRDEAFISEIASHPLFVGKDDAALTRLKQYKLLEARSRDRKAESGNNKEFLRKSNIRVTIEYDVETHIDRAVELVNRTNQLNFTKVRLSDDLVEAREQLRTEIKMYFAHSGLVCVEDSYGNYGFVGFYLINRLNRSSSVRHFCFSCRTLGMGAERWVYDRLGRPELKVVGEVLTNLAEEIEIDWINQGTGAEVEKTAQRFPEVRLRGGCDLDAMLHYLGKHAGSTYSETNYIKGNMFVRMDSSTNLTVALNGVTDEQLHELAQIGEAWEVFETKIFDPATPGTIIVLSAWADYHVPTYRHIESGLECTVSMRLGIEKNLTTLPEEELDNWWAGQGVLEADRQAGIHTLQHFRKNYVCPGTPDGKSIIQNWTLIADAIPEGATVVVVLPTHDRKWGVPDERARLYKSWVRVAMEGRKNVVLIDANDYYHPDEMQDHFSHLDRIVYYRIYEAILKALPVPSEFPHS